MPPRKRCLCRRHHRRNVRTEDAPTPAAPSRRPADAARCNFCLHALFPLQVCPRFQFALFTIFPPPAFLASAACPCRLLPHVLRCRSRFTTTPTARDFSTPTAVLFTSFYLPVLPVPSSASASHLDRRDFPFIGFPFASAFMLFYRC